ncbi:MAG TPA: NmrA/HSCARG family protein [Arthrobacter sp.]|nr:NmrA/HSCARG family protein [Arthrobacter sp.]
MPVDNSPLYGVFAATGKQGGSTANALLDRGARVRALVRRPDSEEARALAARGAEIVLADLGHPQTLAPAMEGLSALWFMTTMTPEAGAAAEPPMGKALADAAVEAGVARIVFNSVGGAERDTGIPHFDSKYQVEKYLKGLDVRTTVIRPVFFMENLRFTAAAENGRIVLRMPLPDGIPLQMVSVRDIGRVAAAALIDPDSIPGGSVEIGGDELTGSQIAATLGEAAGMPASYEALPLEIMAGQPDAQSMFKWFAELPAYQADFEATTTLSGGALSLASWLAVSDWTPPVR